MIQVCRLGLCNVLRLAELRTRVTMPAIVGVDASAAGQRIDADDVHVRCNRAAGCLNQAGGFLLALRVV